MERRFKQLEDDSAETKDLVSRMAEKILGKPEPEPKPKGKPDAKSPAPSPSGAKKFFQDLGILAKDPGV